MKDKPLFLPGLNGLRAIASLAVVFSHTTLALGTFNLNAYILGEGRDGSPQGYRLAEYGVTIFFVLSGFLITYLLQIEKEKHQIDIKKFYIRRILRIWPLYYLYLFAVLLTLYFFKDELVSFYSLIFYLFFTANIPFIFQFAIPFLDHFWSIGVEEQFYSFWPWLIKKVQKNITLIILIFIILQNLLRLVLWYLYPFSNSAVFSVVNRFDCMMIGGLGAILYLNKNKLFLKIFDNKYAQFIALSILGLLIINKYHLNAIVDTFIISIVTLTIIVGQINVKNRLLNLNSSFFDFFGKISYGVYVYHPLIIFYCGMLLKNSTIISPLKYALVYSSVFVSTILIAYFSYNYFEKPFIKIKSKFAVIKSASSKFSYNE
ncbi:acyltransferase [Flavobacterium sp. GT3R68]|uniref:acyltransferase family protein n=1 Tax=Flavobacterium sp. GT3R68 TaxID=2594437 RepID=UPI000F88B159|nr:acyltransferase [Flavobacterium sp. GT3R68]RTY92292.1 acyltransferase [Flavobacterium sp. GSN2]TRW92528.1 acyltransferase [Flavobacterium sp. GT3R68]